MQSQTDLSANGKWNEIYQKALVPTDGNSNSFERDIKICETVGSFKELAEFYGRKIIDEIHSKSTTKAVGPLDSAISNPNTWLFGDIYFHFAAEYEGTPSYYSNKYPPVVNSYRRGRFRGN